MQSLLRFLSLPVVFSCVSNNLISIEFSEILAEIFPANRNLASVVIPVAGAAGVACVTQGVDRLGRCVPCRATSVLARNGFSADTQVL